MSTHRDHLYRWRHRAYQILEHGPVGDRAMRVTSGLIIVLVLVNILAVVLESVPRYEAAYRRLFEAIELVSLVPSRSNICCASGRHPSMRPTTNSNRCRRGCDMLHRLTA